MKTPVWSPNIESLTCRMASSSVANLNATTSGANASFEQTWAVTGTSVRTVGGKNVPSALPPARTRPPIATASSTQPWVRDAWCVVDHRADVGRRIERVAELEVRDARQELVHERVPDRLVDEHPLDADADLAGVGERTDQDPLDRPVEIGRLRRR